MSWADWIMTSSGRRSVRPRARQLEIETGLGACLVEPLQKLVRRKLDLFVAPFGRPVLAGDQPRSVDAAKIAINERVSTLGLVSRLLVEAEVPFGVVVPGVAVEERILVRRLRLNFTPVTFENVLACVDQSASVSDCALID